jgi:hypothetical protein
MASAVPPALRQADVLLILGRTADAVVDLSRAIDVRTVTARRCGCTHETVPALFGAVCPLRCSLYTGRSVGLV